MLGHASLIFLDMDDRKLRVVPTTTASSQGTSCLIWQQACHTRARRLITPIFNPKLYLFNYVLQYDRVNRYTKRRHSQVVRQRIANPLSPGSTPGAASRNLPINHNLQFFFESKIMSMSLYKYFFRHKRSDLRITY